MHNFDNIGFLLREVIVLTPVFIPLFWGLVFITSEFSKNKARYWLGIFMIVTATLYGCHALFFLTTMDVYIKTDWLYNLTSLSVYPMYYIYIRLLTCDVKLKKNYITHFLPAIILSSSLLIISLTLTHEEKVHYYEIVLKEYGMPGFGASSALKLMSVIFYLSRIIFGFQTIIYLILGYILATRHNKRIANFYSNMQGRELIWVKMLSISFLITSCASSVANILGRGLFIDNNSMLAFPAFIFSTMFFIIGILGNNQNFTVNTFNEDEETECPEENENPKNIKLKNNLIKLLEVNKRFLDPELKITDLCRELNTNRTYLSNLINTEFQLSFNDLINKYRTEYAITLLNGDNINYSLQVIATESGFGSLSSFNRAFKKNTGTTVTVFKSTNLQSAIN
jgi:AraC-like DNA-binding protein